MLGLENLSPAQQQALKYGVPLVAALAIGAKLTGRHTAPAATPSSTSGGGGAGPAVTPPAPGLTGYLAPASSDAIGVSQLADFESSITAALQGVRVRQDELASATAGNSSSYLSDDAAFITELYKTILGRAPDPAGFNYWLGILASGRSRAEVTVAFSAGAAQEISRR